MTRAWTTRLARSAAYAAIAITFLVQIGILIAAISVNLPRWQFKLVVVAIILLGVVHYVMARFLKIGVFAARRELTNLEKRMGMRD